MHRKRRAGDSECRALLSKHLRRNRFRFLPVVEVTAANGLLEEFAHHLREHHGTFAGKVVERRLELVGHSAAHDACSCSSHASACPLRWFFGKQSLKVQSFSCVLAARPGVSPPPALRRPQKRCCGPSSVRTCKLPCLYSASVSLPASPTRRSRTPSAEGCSSRLSTFVHIRFAVPHRHHSGAAIPMTKAKSSSRASSEKSGAARLFSEFLRPIPRHAKMLGAGKSFYKNTTLDSPFLSNPSGRNRPRAQLHPPPRGTMACDFPLPASLFNDLPAHALAPAHQGSSPPARTSLLRGGAALHRDP